MIRLFVGLPFPPEIQRLLSHLGATIPGARATPQDQVHLTLRFIGEVEGTVYNDIKEQLASIDAPPLSLRIRSTGHFPPRGKPRIVWAGVDPAGDIIILRNKINYLLSLCGIDPEQRKFHPHVTLARLKNTSPKRVAAFLQNNALLESPQFEIDRVNLYSSTLHPEGALHRIEAAYSLSNR